MRIPLSYTVSGAVAALAVAFGAQAQQTDAAGGKPVVAPLPATSPATDATQAAPADPSAAQVAITPPAAAAGPDAKEFMRQAYLSTEFGIAAAQVALANAQDADAKAAAQKILNDGMKTRQDLIAAIQGSTSDMHFDQAWTDDYKAKLADLKSAPATEFDAKYLGVQGDVTNQTAQAFSAYASAGTDQSIKTFAADTLPVLQAEADTLSAASQGGQ